MTEARSLSGMDWRENGPPRRALPMFFLPQPRKVVLLLFLALVLPAPGHCRTQAEKLIAHGGYALSLNGALIGSHNKDTAFAPASTIKLVTCLAALHTLGADYRFKTIFSLDTQKTLYIRGSGDPYLTSDTVAGIAATLARQGLQQVGDIALDADAFALKEPADGTENSANPYDAANGALAVNFNSLPIRVLADRTVLSGEKQTPLLPIMQDIGRRLCEGKYRINPGAFPSPHPLPATLRYAGELFRAMLVQQGIQVTGRIIAARTPKNLPPFLTYVSEKTVEDLVRFCLYYSNNFLANQLFLACGAERLGRPATWGNGRKAMRTFISSSWPKQQKAIRMVEGSGLSRQDRISPAAMLAVLETFKPYIGLLKSKDGAPGKSGYLSGVHCYAGYFPRGKSWDPFVILLNQQENTRDELLAQLRTLHAGRH